MSRLVNLLPDNTINVSFDPTKQNGLPGGHVINSLASGVGHWALIASVLGVVVGGVMWAFGHFSHNYQQSYNGRKGMIVAALAALLIGGSAQIVQFFYSAGTNIH